MAVSFVENRLREVARNKARMYELILLDYAMPEMDGLETCMKIRAAITETFNEHMQDDQSDNNNTW